MGTTADAGKRSRGRAVSHQPLGSASCRPKRTMASCQSPQPPPDMELCGVRAPPPPRDALEGGKAPPPPSRAPSLRPATVSLAASATLNGICNRQ